MVTERLDLVRVRKTYQEAVELWIGAIHEEERADTPHAVQPSRQAVEIKLPTWPAH
jgi:hypothetical protein